MTTLKITNSDLLNLGHFEFAKNKAFRRDIYPTQVGKGGSEEKK